MPYGSYNRVEHYISGQPSRATLYARNAKCSLRHIPKLFYKFETMYNLCIKLIRRLAFRYMTPKIRLDAADLSPPLLAARSFHLICPSRRCMSMVKNIISARAALPSSPSHQAVFIWEPVPDMCTPSELQNCYQACKSVDVISPNDGELLSFFGEDNVGISERWTLVEKRAEDFLRSGVGENQEGAVVVRAGGKGCYVAVLSRDIGVIGRWLPAYHQDASKVADPTGGGNGFLGGFAVGLIRSEKEHGTEKFIEAATYGSVAASFCIEQVGVPRLESYRQGQELWNGVKPFERLNDFQSRTNGNEAREKVH